MHETDDSAVDRQLRAAFEPDRESVARVVEAAVRPRPRRRRMLRVALAFALVCTVVAWLMLSPRSTPVRAESVKIEYIGGCALLQFPDGSSLVVTLSRAERGAEPGPGLIIVEVDK